MAALRVLLADDHPLFREGIKKILDGNPNIQVVGEAGDGVELLEALKKDVPDLIILDISMPRLQGLDALKVIKADYPRVKILVLTMHDSKGHVFLAFSGGADGYLLKQNAYQDLFSAIETIRQGTPYISCLVSDQVIDLFRPKAGEVFETKLSSREQQVLELIAQGKTSKQVADLLAIGVASVQTYRYKMKKKLRIKSNADLIKYALNKGYTSADY